MSKVALEGNVSGTGTFTIASPNSNTNRTLNLPDASGTFATLERSGTVLQMVAFPVDAGSSTTATSIVNLSASNKTITPKSTNSVLHISVVFQGLITAGGAGVNSIGSFRLLESGGGVGPTAALSVASASGTNVQTQANQSLSLALTNSSLTARSFTLGGSKTGGTSTAFANDQYFTITEVQA